MHILIIEDNFDFSGFLRIILENEGHQVTATTLLREGLDLTRQTPPDLVLLDVELPNGSGLAFFDQPDLRQLPVIVMADYDDGDLDRQLRAVPAEYFIKPISRRDLIAHVNRVAVRKK